MAEANIIVHFRAPINFLGAFRRPLATPAAIPFYSSKTGVLLPDGWNGAYNYCVVDGLSLVKGENVRLLTLAGAGRVALSLAQKVLRGEENFIDALGDCDSDAMVCTLSRKNGLRGPVDEIVEVLPLRMKAKKMEAILKSLRDKEGFAVYPSIWEGVSATGELPFLTSNL